MRLNLGTLLPPGHVLALEHAAISRDRGYIYVGIRHGAKQTDEWALPLLPSLARYLPLENTRLVLEMDGRKPRDLKRAFREMRRRAGLDDAVTASLLRRTAAAHRLDSGIDELTVRLYATAALPGELYLATPRSLPLSELVTRAAAVLERLTASLDTATLSSTSA